MADEKSVTEVTGDSNDNKNTTNNNKNMSFLSRVWNGLFRLHGDDFEKRLEYISKEEATLLDRMKRRSSNWRATAKHLIVVSVILEVVAVAYAITTTQSLRSDWKVRALRVLPIFLLPCLSSVLYWSLLNLTRISDRRDHKTLEKLRAERQAKIDELKERTNYYTTQQLIQRYDTDPAAKAAAASVLASKLGADSGLKVFLGDELQHNLDGVGMSNDVEPVRSSDLRRRKPSDATRSRGSSMVPPAARSRGSSVVPPAARSRGTSVVPPPVSRSRGSSVVPPAVPRSRGTSVVPRPNNEMVQNVGNEGYEDYLYDPLVVEHQDPAALGAQDGGWIARVAALLVGEDPTQSYALICGNCHMHNGLAMKEDFPVINYYCPHCGALNRPKNSGENSPATTTTLEKTPLISADASGFLADKPSATVSPAAEKEPIEKTPPEDAAAQ